MSCLGESQFQFLKAAGIALEGALIMLRGARPTIVMPDQGPTSRAQPQWLAEDVP